MGTKSLGSKQKMAGDKVDHKEVNRGRQYTEILVALNMKTGQPVKETSALTGQKYIWIWLFTSCC